MTITHEEATMLVRLHAAKASGVTFHVVVAVGPQERYFIQIKENHGNHTLYPTFLSVPHFDSMESGMNWLRERGLVE